MSDLLSFEADRRAVNIHIKSYPYAHEELAVYEDIDQVRAVMEKYLPSSQSFPSYHMESQMFDKAFYEEEVKRLCLAFEQQFHYAVFFAYARLREQEIRSREFMTVPSSYFSVLKIIFPRKIPFIIEIDIQVCMRNLCAPIL